MVPMTIKAVLFDWDGVLADSRFLGHECSSKIFEAYGVKPPPLETFLREIGSDYVAYYRKFGLPESATKEDMNKLWDNHFHSPRMKEIGIPLRKGIAETLSELRVRNIKIGIVSSNSSSIIKQAANRHDILKFFDKIRADISGRKTDALKETVRELGVLPREVFFIEDSPQVIADGHAAGVMPVAIMGGFGTEEALRAASPEYIIREIPDILMLL